MSGLATLAIEASTYEGSAALLSGGRIVAERTVAMRGEQSERLMPAVAELLADMGRGAPALARVIVGAGPGSFTSLRIAASIGKGIALGSSVPLYAVSSLLLLVAGAWPALRAGRYLASLDAMRGDRYAAVVLLDEGGGAVQEGPVHLLPAADVIAWAAHEKTALVGPGSAIDAHPHARGAARIALPDRGGAVDLASWEPDYGRHAEAQVRWEAAHGRPLGQA